MNQRVDTLKAAMWSLLAALALSLHIFLAPPIAGPQLYGALAVAGFGLLLPPISTLYMRFRGVNEHAAILTVMGGTALSIVGIGALTFDDLEPEAIFFLGMWWWVVGKFSAESGLLDRRFGYVTMALALLAFAAVVGDLVGTRAAWTAARLALAAWLIGLAVILYRPSANGSDAG